MIGRKLAHYEITELLGQGGMGEVYRARDTKLGRDVALKIVSPEFAADPERLARFAREARTLAALQHANVAAIHGFEEVDDVRFLIMELVDGEELADRIARGPLPLDDARDIALQIAEGLEAAHRKGIVHRDLKPANVKLTPGAEVKILDFGLARAVEDAPAEAQDIANSPTITAAFTQQGVILGTAAYMSPEQARGSPVDERGDIWAFGVILFEMLSGQRLFEGETVSDTLAAVIRAEPEWSRLPTHTPPAVRRLLRRCLAKKPRERLQSIADARLELNEDESLDATPAGDSRLRPTWLLLAAVLALAAGVWLGRSLAPEAETVAAEPIHSSLRLPPGWQVAGWGSPTVEFSPDGRTVAYVASREQEKRLFVHDLREAEPRLVPDGEAAEGPFFSPDGTEVAFGSGRLSGQGAGPGRLRSYSTVSGKTRIVCDLSDYFGGAWREDGTIFFVGALPGPLWKVVAEGGIAKPVGGAEKAEPDENTRSIAWPQLLPDGRHALITIWEGEVGGRAAIMDLDRGEFQYLLLDSTFSRWTKSGGLLTAHPDGRIFMSSFDPAALELRSAPREVMSGVSISGNGAAVIAISQAGDLIYSTGALAGSRRDLSRLAWLGEDGNITDLEGFEEDFYKSVAIAPDGRRVAVASGHSNLWVFDLEQGTRLKLPRGQSAGQGSVLWAPGGEEIVFSGNSTAEPTMTSDLFLQPVDGVQPPRRLASRPGEFYASSFVPGTRVLLHMGYYSGPQLNYEIFSLDLDGGEPQRVLREEDASLSSPALSPDGRWLAYCARVSDQSEIFLRSYPDLSRKIPLGPGRWPKWSADGTKLFFGRGNVRWTESIWVRDVSIGGDSLDLGQPRLLLDSERTIWDWDVHPDGRRVLLLHSVEGSGIVRHFELIQNWSRDADGASR